ncbi:hypothetical protein B0H14DRAFT_3150244 [Mycena olivaceomarginata]|nr:hypothetical protein B0H14DRAFT_3150244 [Mycena olivaceomarginata]
MSNVECQRLADAGDPGKMHEFTLRFVTHRSLPIKIRMPSVPIVLASSVAAGVGLLFPTSRAQSNIGRGFWNRRARLLATRRQHMRTWCGCTTAWFGCTRLSDCLKAGHAEMAAQLGLGTAPSVISFGMKLLDARYGEHKEEFGKSDAFLGNRGRARGEEAAELDKEDAKRFVRPWYKCAASGCPVEASKGNMLRACAGKCEDAYKPRYCTKECQVAVNTFFLRVFAYNASTDDAPKDWKRHKPMCKPGLKVPESGTPAPAARSPRVSAGSWSACQVYRENQPRSHPKRRPSAAGVFGACRGGHNIRVVKLISAQEAKVLAKVLSGSGPGLGTRHVAMDSSNNFLLACWKTGI